MPKSAALTAKVHEHRWPTADRLLVGLACVVIAFSLLQILLFKFGRDQGIYVVVADVMLQGGMPYRDAWDFKPPGVFFVYAVARGLFGDNQWGIRVLEVGGLLGLVWAMVMLGRRYLGDARPGWLAAALAVLVAAQLEFWHTSQPESFGGILTIIALALAPELDETFAAPRPSSWARWIGVGALLGCAGLMKPHLLGAAAVVAGFAAWRLRAMGGSRSQAAAAVAAVSAGAAALWALCTLWFWARGALGDLYQALFVFAPGYASTTWRSDQLLTYYYHALELTAAGSGPVALGLILFLALPRIGERERQGTLLVAGIAAVHLLGIAIQSKFFAYHFGATTPFFAFLAGAGWWKAWLWAKQRGAAALVLVVVVSWLSAAAQTFTRNLPDTFWKRSSMRIQALLHPSLRPEIDAQLYSVADVDYGANVEVAQWLSERTSPEDRVFIWGFEPFIYDASNRRPASRYIYNVPQRVSWEREAARSGLMGELRANLPKLIVVEHNDVFVSVTGNHADSATSLTQFQELRDLIADRYEFRQSVADFDLYELRGAALQ